ncbi:MAG TPA: response regulator transcription factor [Anaerolineales bacterium]|nr:response regulator transcription factor [Anaerolineales bacterium]
MLEECRNRDELFAMVNEHCPDCIIMDIKMPGETPETLLGWLKENHSAISVLILTSHDLDEYLHKMAQAGAAGFICKSDAIHALPQALRDLADGRLAFTLQQQIRANEWYKKVGVVLKELSPREKEILTLLSKAAENAAIAHALQISEKTVAFHLTHIFEKLGVKSRLEAAIWAKDHLSDNLE